ncbi:hypothetical protein [Nocardia caishijiensis]|uniref:Uncharacterized protein n=1 Tax=Nocardia caishijiensis TaxID=184756 RepID=A0ABQ6YPD7_9NOCA|nr:hypothetical protein [Nocardia caishijiensis]KAF0847659.1 hypothetical protein FNL39_103561 [Nocardia caishijiensis]
MSTAISALRSYDSAELPEPVLRRRRSTRAPRPFTLVRGLGRNAAARREVAARFTAHPPVPAESARPAAVVGTSAVAEPRARGARTFDLTEAEVDLAFATVPRWESVGTRSVTGSLAAEPPTAPSRRRVRADVQAADRGPRSREPRPESGLYSSVRVSGARGAHPMVRVRRAQAGLAALALTALATALIVATLLGLAHLRAGSFGGSTDPSTGISQQGDHPQIGLFETRFQN